MLQENGGLPQNEKPTIEAKEIPRFPGYYMDVEGGVWSRWKQKGIKGKKGTVSFISDRWKRLKVFPHSRKSKYLVVNMRNELGVFEQESIHRLMLFTFIGPPLEGQECRHLDGNPRNNKIGNLAWGTAQENADDRKRHGTSGYGENSASAKLSNESALEIRTLYSTGNFLMRELADRFAVSMDTIGGVIGGRIWKEAGGIRKVDNRKKLTEADVKSIRELYSGGGYSYVRLARMYGIDQSQIAHIIKGKQWTWVS